MNDYVYVRNVDCPPGWPASSNAWHDCPSPGAPTEAVLTDGGEVVNDLYAVDSSVIRIVGIDLAVDGNAVPYGDLSALTETLTGTVASANPISGVSYQGGCTGPPCTGSESCDRTITLVPLKNLPTLSP